MSNLVRGVYNWDWQVLGGKVMDSATAISTMVERIVEGFAPERIILFGSHARGTATRLVEMTLIYWSSWTMYPTITTRP